MSSPRTHRDDLLRATVRQHRRRLVTSSFLFVSHQTGEVLIPVVAGLAIDRAVVTGDPASLVRWLVVLAAVFAVLSTSWRLGDRVLTVAVEDAAHRLRLRLTARSLDDVGLAESPAAGQVVSIVSTDAAGTARVLVAIAAGVAATAGLLASALVLLVLSRPLGALVLVGLPVVVLALQLLTRPLERRTSHQRAEAARAAAIATDLLTGLRSLKGLRAETAAAARYTEASRKSLSVGLRASRFGAVHEGGTVLASGAFVAVVALMAGRLAADGEMTVGALVAAIGVTQFLAGPLWRIGYAGAEVAKARASAERVASVLHGAPRIVDGDQHPGAPGTSVALRSISHGPLAGLDVEIGAGSFVALVALDPADAATIIDLLARRDDPTDGSVEVDGTAMPLLKLDHLRRQVVVARHDAAVFAGSVVENVAAVAPDLAADPVALDGLLADVGAGDLRHILSDGLDTALTSRGMRLSGGQRQRITLARALAADPPVLVLHDPTTAIDPVTEAIAAAGVRARRTGRTTIVIASSPALLGVADDVVVIENGAVVDRGTHEALLRRNEKYRTAVLT